MAARAAAATRWTSAPAASPIGLASQVLRDTLLGMLLDKVQRWVAHAVKHVGLEKAWWSRPPRLLPPRLLLKPVLLLLLLLESHPPLRRS